MAKKRELVLDIKDIIASVLKRWRFIFISTVIGALILTGIKAYTYYKNEDFKYSEENKQLILLEITKSEANEVENLFERFLAYKKRISYSESYLSDAILMKLDPASLSTMNVEYSINSNQHSSISSLTSDVLGNEEYEKIASVFGGNASSSRVSEIAYITNLSGSVSDETLIDLDSANEKYSGIVNHNYIWIIRLTAMADNEEQCTRIIEIIERALFAKEQKLKDAGITVSINKIGTNYTESASEWLADRQRTKISETSTIKSEYDTFERTTLTYLSSAAKNYFTFLKNSNDNKKDIIHNTKNLAMGGIAGCLAALLVSLIHYFICGRIKNKEDYLYRVDSDDIISVVYSRVNHKGMINKLVYLIINKLFYDIDRDTDLTEKISITAKRIHQLCVKNDVDSLYIVNDTDKETAMDSLQTIIDAISKEGVSVFHGKPLSKVDDYSEFENASAVVYFGSFNDSKVKHLIDYFKLFNENASIVIGSIFHSEV